MCHNYYLPKDFPQCMELLFVLMVLYVLVESERDIVLLVESEGTICIILVSVFLHVPIQCI